MRTPSMTIEQAEAALGLRGTVIVNKDNRSTVRKWLSAQGFPAMFAGGLSMQELHHAYNDTSSIALDKLRRKLAEATETADEIGQEETGGAIIEHSSHQVEETKVEVKANSGNGHAKDDASLLIELLSRIGKSVDPDQVRSIVKQELQGVVFPLQVEIIKPDGTAHQVEGNVHPMFPKLLKATQARSHDGYVPNMFISGEASSGKTHATKQLAKTMELPWHFNGAISMPHEMLGFIDAAGNYHRTPFREAYEHGGVYVFDEVDRSDAVALLAINPHLANGVATFPDDQIKRHMDCIIICTANTWGGGASADYCGATKLDAAFMSRFAVRLGWNIDEDFERTISGDPQWCGRIQLARSKAKLSGLKVMIDVRQTLAGAALIRAGFSSDEAAEMTYLANLTDAQRAMVS